MEPSDAQLMGGDPAGFESLFARHHARIHGWLRRRLPADLAEDLAAEVFLVAWSTRDRYDQARPDAAPWLFGIASNLARRHYRQETRGLRALARSGVDPLVEDTGAHDRLDAAAQKAALAAALARLRPGEREVLLLNAWADLAYEEIADALGVPIGTVRSRLHRARAKMRTALEPTEAAR